MTSKVSKTLTDIKIILDRKQLFVVIYYAAFKDKVTSMAIAKRRNTWIVGVYFI